MNIYYIIYFVHNTAFFKIGNTLSDFGLRDIVPYLVDLGNDLCRHPHIAFQDIQRVLGTENGRAEIINAIARSNTAEREKQIEEARKGAPLSTEELQAAEAAIDEWLYDKFYNTYAQAADVALQKSRLHLRPEYYNELPRRYRVIFRLYFLCHLSNEEIAERLELEEHREPRPERGAYERARVSGREASGVVQTLIDQMRSTVTEKIRDAYQRERDALLEQQAQEAIDAGCPIRIDEITEGIAPKIRYILQEMDVVYLAELRKVTEINVRNGAAAPRVSEASMAKLADIMRQHGVSFKPNPSPYF